MNLKTNLAYIKEFGFFFFLRIAVAVSSAWELLVSAMGRPDRTVALICLHLCVLRQKRHCEGSQ